MPHTHLPQSTPVDRGPALEGDRPLVSWPSNSAICEAVRQRKAELSEPSTPAPVTPAPSPLEELFACLTPTVISALPLDEIVSLIDAYIADTLGGPSPPELSTARDSQAFPAPSDSERTATPNATYLSQQDNETQGGKAGGSQCGATSLTMSLLSLYDHEEAALQAATAELLEEHGETPDADHSPEEAVVQLMLATDWNAAFEQSPQFFEHSPQWRLGAEGSNVIKSPFAQAYTASRYGRCGDSGATVLSTATTITEGESSAALDFDGRWDFALEAWRAGGEVSFQGDFTDSGHVVQIVQITEDAMVLHDPYGMRVSDRYLKNGHTADGLSESERAVVEQRAGGDRALLAALEQGTACDAWGAFNHYSRQELEGLEALTWLLVIHPDKSAPDPSEALPPPP